MKPYEIYTAENVLSPNTLRRTLASVYRLQPLWEQRRERNQPYRNASWYTIGTPLYLDIQDEKEFPAYEEKLFYFNSILRDHFWDMYMEVADAIGKTLSMPTMPLSALMHVGMPGFHIFPPHETMSQFFGKWHQDLQYRILPKLPKSIIQVRPADEDKLETYSFTVMLAQPYDGASLLCRDADGFQWTHEYQKNALVLHHGRFDHAIGPFKSPVLPTDFRISYQGHGVVYGGNFYIYW